MSSIKINYGGSEYMVRYEYQPAQKGDSETEAIPESYEVTEIKEVLNDGDLSDDLISGFSHSEIMEVNKIIAHEVKFSY